MILVRDVFQLQFGKAREAVALWKDGATVAKKLGFPMGRLLTDLTGPYYTLVLENTFASLAEWEKQGKQMMSADEWRKWYQKFLPLAVGGHREIFTVVE